jgi:hypothetical protein
MTKHDANLLLAGVPLVMFFAILLTITVVAVVIPQPDRPDILILLEETVTGYNGLPVLLVDYMVGGIAMNATFTPYQMNEYWALIEHLKATGRVRYALPRYVP